MTSGAAKNPFQTGQVAMQLDGEWRLGMALDGEGRSFDDRRRPAARPRRPGRPYGKGYITGTIAGIAATSRKQNAAWELVKYITTDTDAVVGFANAIHNVPSTFAALKSPKLNADPRFKTFLDIAANPHSEHRAVLDQRRRVPHHHPGPRLRRTRAARSPTCKPGLKKATAQIDTDIAQAK